MKRAADTLNWIESLRDNWDGEGAPAFASSLIAMARGILGSLPRAPFIAPTSRGSIQMEYEDESFGYLEFELFSNGKVKEYFKDPSLKSSTRSITPSNVQEDVERFYGARLPNV